MRWLNYALSFCLILNTAAWAAEPTQPVQNMWTLIEGLKQATKNIQAVAGKTEQEMVLSTQQGLLDGIAQEGAMLTPDDYKEFLFESMERYIANPDERIAIYSVWKYIGGYVAPEIASYETQIWQPVAKGLGNWMMLFLLLRSPTQFLMKRAENPGVLVNLANSTAPGKLLSKVGVTDELHQALVLSGLSAATIGIMERLWANHGPHKIDPTPVLEATQIFVGCDLMNAAVDGSRSEDQLKDMLKQSDLLVEQFGDLSSLNPNDPRVQQILASVPNEPQWAQLAAGSRRCDSVNLEHLHHFIVGKLSTMEKPK